MTDLTETTGMVSESPSPTEMNVATAVIDLLNEAQSSGFCIQPPVGGERKLYIIAGDKEEILLLTKKLFE